MRYTKIVRRVISLAGLLLTCAPGFAQEANLSEAATQPAKGRITWREQVRFMRYELNDRNVDQIVLNTRLSLGLSGRLSAVLDVPLISREDSLDGSLDADGLGDIQIGLKHRFWQHDRGPIETERLSVIGGVRLPTGADQLSTEGFDPYIGLVYTKVSGRHGANASAKFQYSSDGMATPITAGLGRDDLLVIEASYLYRLSPAAYTADTVGSLYAAVESFVDYETNGDIEWRLAPGLLWEARRWAAELSVIFPVARSIEKRARTDWGLALGVRVLF